MFDQVRNNLRVDQSVARDRKLTVEWSFRHFVFPHLEVFLS